jgi:hypothetical protein
LRIQLKCCGQSKFPGMQCPLEKAWLKLLRISAGVICDRVIFDITRFRSSYSHLLSQTIQGDVQSVKRHRSKARLFIVQWNWRDATKTGAHFGGTVATWVALFWPSFGPFFP